MLTQLHITPRMLTTHADHTCYMCIKQRCHIVLYVRYRSTASFQKKNQTQRMEEQMS